MGPRSIPQERVAQMLKTRDVFLMLKSELPGEPEKKGISSRDRRVS
jgi:hypothetical protein